MPFFRLYETIISHVQRRSYLGRVRAARHSGMQLAVLTETVAGERRVAVVPDIARRLCGAGWTVSAQSGAGAWAAFTDADYLAAGAQVVPDAASCLSGAGAVAHVQPLTAEEAQGLADGTIVLSFLQPAASLDALRVLMAKRCSVFSFDLLPRISRAQSM
ncbi:MAG: hypothetical protein ACRDL8_01715, partial [Solirubrobacteraceae bacterium]